MDTLEPEYYSDLGSEWLSKYLRESTHKELCKRANCKDQLWTTVQSREALRIKFYYFNKWKRYRSEHFRQCHVKASIYAKRLVRKARHEHAMKYGLNWKKKSKSDQNDSTSKEKLEETSSPSTGENKTQTLNEESNFIPPNEFNYRYWHDPGCREAFLNYRFFQDLTQKFPKKYVCRDRFRNSTRKLHEAELEFLKESGETSFDGKLSVELPPEQPAASGRRVIKRFRPSRWGPVTSENDEHYDMVPNREYGEQIPNRESSEQIPNRESSEQIPNREFSEQSLPVSKGNIPVSIHSENPEQYFVAENMDSQRGSNERCDPSSSGLSNEDHEDRTNRLIPENTETDVNKSALNQSMEYSSGNMLPIPQMETATFNNIHQTQWNRSTPTNSDFSPAKPFPPPTCSGIATDQKTGWYSSKYDSYYT